MSAWEVIKTTALVFLALIVIGMLGTEASIRRHARNAVKAVEEQDDET